MSVYVGIDVHRKRSQPRTEGGGCRHWAGAGSYGSAGEGDRHA